jgi:NAD(P)-dependent dehydrogenase (short-subunit alcohol dehydrogenase family)
MDRVTLITGATKGIGLACAEVLAARGHRVVGLARHPFAGHFPGDVHVVDAGDRKAMVTALAALASAHAFNGLVNNVGYVTPRPLGAIDLDDYDRTFEINVTAALLSAQALVAGMKAQRFGRIVNIASEAVLGLTQRTAYAAAKAAVMSFTRTWALELAAEGITVNTVSPGPVETELFARNNPPGSEVRDRKLARIPVGRIGVPEDIANAVGFFMAAESEFVTGQCLYVCGGSSLGSGSFL